jgi:hypothetical protein
VVFGGGDTVSRFFGLGPAGGDSFLLVVFFGLVCGV